MKLNKSLFSLYVFGFLSQSIQAQEKQEALETQEVLVIKSYTPSLSDAFMISEDPQIPDSLINEDKVLTFKIKPVAVVSTFEPNKATPLKLQKQSPSTPFNTFFSGGVGV